MTARLNSLALLLALTGTACEGDRNGKGESESGSSRTELLIDDSPPAPLYPPFDPTKVTPLEVLYFPEPVGEGYRRTSVKFGPSLYSAKHLTLGNGDAQFLTPTRIVVNELRKREPNVFMSEITKSVLLDVETGETLLEFGGGRYRQWYFGLGIVFLTGDDDRPYLLDAEAGTLVLAMPTDKYDWYEYGKNYWIRLSPIAKRVWIYALDWKGIVHVYEWEDRSVPPEMPNNPFPLFPYEWDPSESSWLVRADTEEVVSDGRATDTCRRAVLIPPKGFECLDALEFADSQPLSDGWRYVRDAAIVFNRDGRTWDLSTLCKDSESAYAKSMMRSPAAVKIRCQTDDAALFVWSPPDRVRSLNPVLTQELNNAKLLMLFHDNGTRYELAADDPDGTKTVFDPMAGRREFVAKDYSCDELRYSAGDMVHSATCTSHGTVRWLEIFNKHDDVRARFQAAEVAISSADHVVAVIRRGSADHIVRISMK